MTNENFIASVTLEHEKWKQIRNYENSYAVSNYGRVLSLGRYRKARDGGKTWVSPRVLKEKTTRLGYKQVALFRDNALKYYSVHRLVALAFIPNPFDLPQVDHIDGNKANNNVNNLRWCSAVENMRNPLTMKRMRNTVYDNITKHKRFTRPVASIRNGNIVKMYPSLRSVSQDGYNPDCVWNCCNWNSKIHGELQWMYLTSEKLLSSVNQRTLYPMLG